MSPLGPEFTPTRHSPRKATARQSLHAGSPHRGSDPNQEPPPTAGPVLPRRACQNEKSQTSRDAHGTTPTLCMVEAHIVPQSYACRTLLTPSALTQDALMGNRYTHEPQSARHDASIPKCLSKSLAARVLGHLLSKSHAADKHAEAPPQEKEDKTNKAPVFPTQALPNTSKKWRQLSENGICPLSHPDTK